MSLYTHNYYTHVFDFLHLGCPVHLPTPAAIDKIESLSLKEKQIVCECLFHTVNWFIEVNFLSQTGHQGKTVSLTLTLAPCIFADASVVRANVKVFHVYL